MVRFVEQILDGFGLYQDMQCKELKNMLMEPEDQERQDGRVLLANLYVPYRNGNHSFFVERPEYLKNLGSLDDTDPNRPSVIVPNYLYGRNYCLASENDFQSFCCVDQCNVLMESLERSIAHPVAAPGVVADLVAALASDTAAAPRNLSGSLRRKLDLIAEQHGGHVPLHGRMFAQFMHHAFPNECSQPRAPGAAEAPMSHEEWRANRNSSSVAPKEMSAAREIIQQLAERAAETEQEQATCSEEPSMLWTAEEELLTSLDLETLSSVRAKSQQGQEGVVRGLLRLVAMCAAVASMIAILAESVRSSASLLRPGASKGACAQTGGLPQWASASGKSHFV